MKVFVRCNERKQPLEVLDTRRQSLLAKIERLVLVDAKFLKDGSGLLGRLESVWGAEILCDLSLAGMPERLAIGRPWLPFGPAEGVFRQRRDGQFYFRTVNGDAVERASRVKMYNDVMLAEGMV